MAGGATAIAFSILAIICFAIITWFVIKGDCSCVGTALFGKVENQSLNGMLMLMVFIAGIATSTSMIIGLLSRQPGRPTPNS